MPDKDDWALAARARDGDAGAFALLVRRYQQPILHFCLRMVGARGDAEDLAQDVFVSLHRNIGRIEPRARLSTLLFGIARNLALNHLRDGRRRGRDTAVSLEAAGLDPPSRDRPDRRAQAAETGALLEQLLDRLPPEQKEALVLREFNGLDYAAIAEIAGCPVGTVRSRLARARETLRRDWRSMDKAGL